jgi:hypothetical protein
MENKYELIIKLFKLLEKLNEKHEKEEVVYYFHLYPDTGGMLLKGRTDIFDLVGTDTMVASWDVAEEGIEKLKEILAL